jgi:hypothetical protein
MKLVMWPGFLLEPTVVAPANDDDRPPPPGEAAEVAR